MLHGLRGQPDAEILKALELRSDWFLKEYKIAAANYNAAQTINAIALLKTYDLRSKGVNNDGTSTGEGELMKELFWKIMH
jgi:DNA polymerase-3 subunit delta